MITLALCIVGVVGVLGAIVILVAGRDMAEVEQRLENIGKAIRVLKQERGR